MITRTHMGTLWQTQNMPRGTDRKFAGEIKRGHPKTILTESEVLEARAKSEFFHWTDEALADEFGTSVLYMSRLLDYIVRRKLIARPEHANIPAN